MKNQIVRLGLNPRNEATDWYHWGSIFITLIFIAFLLSGCGTSKGVKQARRSVEEAYEIQKPIQVRTSLDDNRPEWTKKTSFENDEGMMFFTGGFLNGNDYSLTLKLANSEGLKILIQSISQFIRAEFTHYVKGSNAPGREIDRYVEDGIATFTDALHMQGIRQREVYYEQIFSPSVMVAAYNVFVMLEISRADYLHAKAEVLRRLRNKFSKAGEKEAKDKAESLLEKLKQEASRYGA
jgi:hypothetical protein